MINLKKEERKMAAFYNKEHNITFVVEFCYIDDEIVPTIISHTEGDERKQFNFRIDYIYRNIAD